MFMMTATAAAAAAAAAAPTTTTAMVVAAYHQHHSKCAEKLWTCNIRTYISVNSVDKRVAQHKLHSNTNP